MFEPGEQFESSRVTQLSNCDAPIAVTLMNNMRARLIRIGRLVSLALVVIAVSGSAAWLGTASSRHSSPGTALAARPFERADSVQRVGPDSVRVPADVAARLGLRTSTASTPSQPRSLPAFNGTLSLDNNLVSRVYSRFPGEVLSLGTAASVLPTRAIRVGDRVTKGQTLAVVSSTALGEKKSELLDALSKLKRDQDFLASYKDPAQSGVLPASKIRDAERDVESDRVAVGKAELTLRSWRLTDEEIATIRAEAAELAKPNPKRTDPAAWPRSLVTAPRDGTIIELNTGVTMVDTTTPLVVVADLSQLAVWAHVYEEDLPLLQQLPQPIRWTVNIPSRPGLKLPGTLDTIGAVIHPDQHTALISGTVANPDGSLRSGMYVTVTVELPPPRGELEVPAEALVEDGRESLVFVRSASDPAAITRHRVKVAQRFRDSVLLAADVGGIRPGDEVVTAGSLLLNEAMNELPPPKQ
jgi:membrane fusion protein, heavy metal efflux system